MLFHKLEFAVLFLLTFALAIWGGSRTRRWTLFLGSLAFYAWFSVPLVSLLIVATFLDYFVGIGLDATSDERKRRGLLLISLVGNLGLLFFFKYTNWILSSLNDLSGLLFGKAPFPVYDIVLPLGISFYTFQALSYTIDVYRHKLKATRSALTYGVFVSFYPHQVAGPILRAARMIPQLEEGSRYLPNQVRHGIGCFAFGLFKKVVLADNLSVIANAVYNGSVADQGALTVLFGTYAFAFQIYCDFSGYSDMARGLGFMLGYDVGPNFDFPYFATSIRDFWKRWHMSLSAWLRDYLYISLGGSRCSNARRNFNLLTTMFLGGLWHGASWHFVVWGAIHGIWIAAEHEWERWRGKAAVAVVPSGGSPRALKSLLLGILTFHGVCVTWVFFRAVNIGQAFDFLGALLRWGNSAEAPVWPVLAYSIPILVVDWMAVRTNVRQWLMSRPVAFWTVVAASLALVMIFGRFEGEDFVYFQF
jgi:D-alanyl-lipoteichoic acid acyltransferase DltB (MBOAT superfamily)